MRPRSAPKDQEYYFLAELGLKIAMIRRARGLSQEQLGKLIGSNQAYICNLEGGRINASVISLLKIAHVLKLKIVLEDL